MQAYQWKAGDTHPAAPISQDPGKLTKDRTFFEWMLIVVVIAMAFIIVKMGSFSIVVLNLFYLPVVLSAYYLGRNYSGTLAFFSVVAVTIAVAINSTGFSAYNAPIMIGLVITVWGAVLGLTSLMVGTLSDERAARLEELHEAYVGVVDVLATYLQSADPQHKARSIRVAELSQEVAATMKLPPSEVDDVRVAALLHDMGNLEVTTKLISRAVNTLQNEDANSQMHTFLGSDLVHSLGSVMHGAVPLVVAQNDDLREAIQITESGANPMPAVARIIRTVRTFDELTSGGRGMTVPDAITHLRQDAAMHPAEIVDVLERIVSRAMPVGLPSELLPV